MTAERTARGARAWLRRHREGLWGYFFIAPQIFGLAVFVLFPVCFAVALCFLDWNFLDAPVFVGLANFKEIFTDAVFYKAILNTVIYIAGTVPLTLVLSLLLALFTNRRFVCAKAYRAAFFLPMITSSVSIAMVWFWIYSSNYGILNNFLSALGVKSPPHWLTERGWARVAVIVMSVWLKMGYYYVIFDAGLKNISREYYEAADIDGAGKLTVLLRITVPMLSPVLFFVSVMLFIDVFNMFSEAYVLTKGGPNFATYTLVMMVYFKAFGGEFEMGQASVVAMVLFLLVAIVTFVQFKVSKRLVNYDVA